MDMKRTFLGGLIGIFPCAAFSLGIGEMELDSYLHAPLEAKIPIFSSEDLANESIRVSLADSQAFQRAGLERYHHLNKLMFEVKRTDKGEYFIELKSKPPIREPFLSFLLEISWSTGSLVKEYTVLLDPPTVVAPATTQVLDSSPEPVSMHLAQSDSFEVIPVKEADTLWAIAMRYRPQGMSVFSTMQAIHQNNPNAFIANNMNLLKAGTQLEIPGFGAQNPQEQASEQSEGITPLAAKKQIGVIDFSELQALQPSSNTTDVGLLETAETTQEQIVADSETSTQASVPAQGGLLKLVVANKEVEDSTLLFEEADIATEASGGSTELSEKLALTEESLDTLIRENIELRQQVASLREQAMNFDNGIELANAELKSMQAAQAKELHEIRKRIRESLEANTGGSSVMWLSLLLGLFTLTTAALIILWYREKSVKQESNVVAQPLTETAVDAPAQEVHSQGQKDLTIKQEDLVELETLDETNEDITESALAVSEEALLSLLAKEPLNQAAHLKLLRLYHKADNEMAFQRHKDSIPEALLSDEDFMIKLNEVDSDALPPAEENQLPGEPIQPILKSDELKQAVSALTVPNLEATAETDNQETEAEESSGLRLQPVEAKLNTPKTAKESAVFRVEEDSDLGSEDKNATKLDLARAFIEMNSIYNARLMLQQVMEEGSDSQADEAKELLKRT